MTTTKARCWQHRRVIPCARCLLPSPAFVPRPRIPAPTTVVLGLRWIRAGWDRIPLLAAVVRPPSAWAIIEYWRPSFFATQDDV